MKAVLPDRRFSDPRWMFERKLDGIRCVAIRSGSAVKLLSRNDLSLNARYPELAEALAAESCGRIRAKNASPPETPPTRETLSRASPLAAP